MDPDIFDEARRSIPESVFDAASVHAMPLLQKGISSSRRIREDERRTRLVRSLDWMTGASWMLNCWRRCLEEDLRNVYIWEIVIWKRLPRPLRAHIFSFLYTSKHSPLRGDISKRMLWNIMNIFGIF